MNPLLCHMPRKPLKIESMLERIGSADVPEDTSHRYTLRRELLCSKFFGDHCARQQRWNRLLTFTMPLVTGGLIVVVFSVVGVSLNEPAELAAELNAAPAQTSSKQETQRIHNEFVDAREPALAYELMQFVPVETANYILLR